jgi:hypothetical protein
VSPQKPLVYGQLGGASRVHVSDDGVIVTDGDAEERVRLGRLSGTEEEDNETFGLQIWSDDGDVIIDGTSQMYRIQAVGDLTITIPVSDFGENSSATLTGLGTQTATPAHLSFVADALGTSASRNGMWNNTVVTSTLYAASSSGGSPTVDFLALGSEVSMHTLLNGSDQVVARLGGVNGRTGTAFTYYGLYNILDEAAL